MLFLFVTQTFRLKIFDSKFLTQRINIFCFKLYLTAKFTIFFNNQNFNFFYKIDPPENLILIILETWILKIGPFLAYLLKNLLRLILTCFCYSFTKIKINHLSIYLFNLNSLKIFNTNVHHFQFQTLYFCKNYNFLK